MAVADIFTALTENRPYRSGISKSDCLRILKKLVEDNQICEQGVGLVEDYYTELFELVSNS